MKHDEAKERLFAFHDGELAAGERREVEVHLETCAECRRELAVWKKVAGAFFRPVPVQSSEAFVQGVMEKLREVEEPLPALRDRLFPRWLVPAMGFAFAVMLFTLALPVRETSVSAESLLLADGREGALSGT